MFKFPNKYFRIDKINSHINTNQFRKFTNFVFVLKKNYGKDDTFTQSDIKKKLHEKFDFETGKRKVQNFESRYSNVSFDKIENDDLKDLLKRYVDHVNEREKRRLNFNRKDRWKQRELDDIMKNFDVQQAKFKDYSKLVREANINIVKEFSSIEEIYFYLDELLKEGFLEKHIGMALDIFIKDINFFKSEDVNNRSFRKFISQISQNIISLNDDAIIYKTAKFLDWYNIDDKNCWYNLERLIVNRKNIMNRTTLLKILDHFAHQNEGSMEFYDLYQYLFWCGDFEKVNNSDFISLGYNLFITKQGYSQFFYDYYKQLLQRITHKESTFDLLKVIQTYSEISQYYFDIFKKIEDIILSRYEQLELDEVTVLACAYAVSGAGSPIFFDYLEKIIVARFKDLDKSGFREVVRALIVSQIGSPNFYQLIKLNIKFHLDMFNLNEKILIVKCYSDTNHGDKEFFKDLEKSISDNFLNAKDVLLEEICLIAECLSKTKIFSREFQKVFEQLLSQKIKDITANKKVCKFLFTTFYKTGMCSVGMMNLLLKALDDSKNNTYS